MPTLSKPVNIPGPWAYNGDKNTIPDSGADIGLASWAQGWGLINQLPLAAGGIPPARADFNGALNALSAHTAYQQTGAYYEWSAELMYPFAARVLGSDGKLYDWVSASGAGTPAGAQDPATDTAHAYWQPAVTAGDLPEFDGTTIKEINGKYGVPEFTAPTASAPGKAGLVPPPAATTYPQNVILSANEFQGVDLAFMHPTALSAETNRQQLDLGALSGEGLNIDNLLRAGIFAATNFSGTLPVNAPGGVLFNIMSYDEESQLYYGHQFLFVYGGNAYYRTHNGGIPPGGAISWREWYTLGAPRPHDGGSHAGWWRPISNGNAGGSVITLPSGGTWAYFVHGYNSSGGMSSVRVSTAAGGTTLNVEGSGTYTTIGLVWRVV